MSKIDIQKEIAFRNAVTKLHNCGPRMVYEIIKEIAKSDLDQAGIIDLAINWGDRCDPEIYQSLGADRLPVLPELRIVEGD